MPDTIRTRRVAELIKHELASVISQDINDKRVHDVVITKVRVTKDLSLARVYFSSYDKLSLGDIQTGLDNSKGFIRRKLMERVHLKKLPTLVFERDNTQDSAYKIDELLKNIAGENRELKSDIPVNDASESSYDNNATDGTDNGRK